MAFGDPNGDKRNFTQWIISMQKEVVLINESCKWPSVSLIPIGFHGAIRMDLFVWAFHSHALAILGKLLCNPIDISSGDRENNH